MLLCSAALVIEGNDALGRTCQIGDDEADARVQLARMPFDLGHDVALLVPALGLYSRSWQNSGAPRAAVAQPGA